MLRGNVHLNLRPSEIAKPRLSDDTSRSGNQVIGPKQHLDLVSSKLDGHHSSRLKTQPSVNVTEVEVDKLLDDNLRRGLLI